MDIDSVVETEEQEEPSAIVQQLSKNPPFPKKTARVNLRKMVGQTAYIDPRRIRPMKNQPREEDNPGFKPESIQELADSIEIAGQSSPGKVRPVTDDPRYDAELVSGERRWRACLLKERMFIAEVLDPNLSEEQLFIIAFMANAEGEPYTALEKAKAMLKCKDELEMKIKEIAAMWRITPGAVSNYLNAFQLEEGVRRLLVTPPPAAQEGKSIRHKNQKSALSFQLVPDLIKLPPDEQRLAANKIVTMGMSLAKARRYLAEEREKAGNPRRNKPPKAWFDGLQSVVRSAIDKIGRYDDHPVKEIKASVAGCDVRDIRQLARELKGLGVTVQSLQKILESTLEK